MYATFETTGPLYNLVLFLCSLFKFDIEPPEDDAPEDNPGQPLTEDPDYEEEDED